MRRLPNDLPYTFRPPTAGGWLRPLGLHVNRRIHLARKYRIGRIEEQGFGRVRELSEDGHSLMLAPNHSDHSDPQMIMKLEEDLLGFPNYPVARTAKVTAGVPIAISNRLATGEIPAKGGALQLTELLEKRLGDLLR